MSRTRTGKLTLEHLAFQNLSWDEELPSSTQKRNIALLAKSIEIAEITRISETRFAENSATEIKIAIIDDFKNYLSETNGISAWASQSSIELEPATISRGAQAKQSRDAENTFEALMVAGNSPEDSLGSSGPQ